MEIEKTDIIYYIITDNNKKKQTWVPASSTWLRTEFQDAWPCIPLYLSDGV